MTTPPLPYAFAVDPGSRLAYARMWGEVTGADMLAAVVAVHESPEWEEGFDAVWDCSAVTAHIVTPEEVPPIVREEALAGEGRDTLIESPGIGESALSEMLAAFCRRQGKQMTVHATLAGGLAALGREALPEPLVAARRP